MASRRSEFEASYGGRRLISVKGWRAHVLSFLMGIVFAPMVLFAQLDGSRKVDLREDRVLMVLQCAWWATLVTLLAWGLWSVLT